MNRVEILEDAKKQISGKRVEDYGKPEDNFLVIADFWGTYKGVNFTPKDVAIMMALMKIARIRSDTKSDSYVDLAGYAACAGEIAFMEKERNNDKACLKE